MSYTTWREQQGLGSDEYPEDGLLRAESLRNAWTLLEIAGALIDADRRGHGSTGRGRAFGILKSIEKTEALLDAYAEEVL